MREHLIEKAPISEVCDKHGLQPAMFYQWSAEGGFENGATVFDQPRRKSSGQEAAEAGRIAALEAKVRDKNEVLAEMMGEYVAQKKNAWGALTGVRATHDTRDAVVDFVNCWSSRTEIPASGMVRWLGISSSKLYGWSAAGGLRQGQRAQRLGATRPLARRLGEAGHVMTEAQIEIIIQRARENLPGARRRIISDNGPQFMAKDFKTFIRICGMTHVRTSPY